MSEARGSGDAGGGAPQLPAVQTWPPNVPLALGEGVAATCAGCATPWRVHTSMAGFRLRCRCGAWVDVPTPPPPPMVPLPEAAVAPTLDADRARVPAVVAGATTDAHGLVVLAQEPGETTFAPIPTDLPLAPGALLQASAQNQARWTSRTVVEFTAMMAALIGPQLLALLLARGQEFELLLPLASLLSAVLLLPVLAWAGPYARLGFQRASPRYWLEALVATVLALGLAWAWMQLIHRAFPNQPEDPLDSLRQNLGVPAALLVVAATPAVLEEIIFRGLLQGRLMALLGVGQGLLVTAAAFAICHTAPPVLLVHISLGLYLGWLRHRSDSLLPGMLMHFLYNGTLVLMA